MALTPSHTSGLASHTSATKTKKTRPWSVREEADLGTQLGLECSVTRASVEAGQGGSTEGGSPVEVCVMFDKTPTSGSPISLCTKWEYKECAS